MDEKPSKIQEITNKYTEGKKLHEFAESLGVEASRQSVHQWKNGDRIPSLETLFAVLYSPHATGQAKAWAGECLAVLQNGVMERKGVN